jgi:site-specific recombinase XerD
MFYLQWHQLQSEAGIAIDSYYKLHDLKNTCGTQLGTVANAFQVQAMLDHASVATSQHYCAGDEQLRAALEKMPHPAEFDR